MKLSVLLAFFLLLSNACLSFCCFGKKNSSNREENRGARVKSSSHSARTPKAKKRKKKKRRKRRTIKVVPEQVIAEKSHEQVASIEDRTVLLGAIRDGNTDLATAVCKRPGVDVNQADDYGWTPLHAAAQIGNAVVVSQLLQAGADVNAISFFATEYSNISQEHRFLDASECAAKGFKGAVTPLFVAARNGHADVVKLLLKFGATVEVVHTGSVGESPHQLVWGHEKAELDFVEDGRPFDADVVFASGCSALHSSAREGHDDVVEVLLRQGAQPDAVIRDGVYKGDTPLVWAARKGRRAVTRRLSLDQRVNIEATASTGGTPLFWAARNGHAETVVELLEHGAEVNAVVNKGKLKGQTALYAAAERGKYIVVELLLEAGADIEGSGAEGMVSPLVRAAQVSAPLRSVRRVDSVEIVWRLCEHGAQVNGTDSDGLTPLHRVAKSAEEDVVTKLLECDAEVNAGNMSEFGTPLHFAVQLNSAEDFCECRDRELIVCHLFSRGALAIAEDSEGVTPLHNACSAGFVRGVQLLLKNDADVNAATVEAKETPLHFAARKGSVDCAQQLLDAGADKYLRNSQGETACQVAAKTLRKYSDLLKKRRFQSFVAMLDESQEQ